MKLKEYNTENCISHRGQGAGGVATVALNIKVGLFRFNKIAVELIKLKDGDHVKFYQDEDDKDCWYLEKSNDEKGFPLRYKESVGNGLLFNNAALAKQIADSVNFTGNSGKCLIAGKPTEHKNGDNKKQVLWGVLTSTLINK